MASKLGSTSREREIVDLVRRQQGVVAHGQLTSLGVGRRTIHELKNAWDEASRLKLLRVPEVAAVYERGRGRRARTRIRPFLLVEQRYVEASASPLEDRFADVVSLIPNRRHGG